MWWVSIPIYPIAAYCLAFWNVDVMVRARRARKSRGQNGETEG
jgi:hypothetical protein